jgi:hypothetical protein
MKYFSASTNRASVSPWLTTFLGVAILLLPFILPAQQSMFTKVYWDIEGYAQAYATVKTPGHGFGVAGVKDMSPLALKADSMGNIIWSKKMTDNTGAFYAVAPTTDSGMVFAGNADGSSYGFKDLYFVKTNKAGDTLWTRTIDMGSGEETAWAIEQTFDGGFIAAGNAQTDIPPYFQAAVLRLDPQGDLVWGRLINFDDSPASAFSVRQTSDSAFLVTGVCNVVITSSEENMFMMKLTQGGEVAWSNVVQIEQGFSEGLDVVSDPTGFTWLFDATMPGMGLIRTDFDGNPIWSRQYGWGQYFGFYAHSAQKLSRTSDGGYIFVDGGSYGPGWTVKTDSGGLPVAMQSLFLNTIGAMETDDGGFLFTGNGPIIGVEMSGTDNPQIGLIKSDELFNTYGCVYPEYPYYDTVTVTVFAHPVTSVAAGSVVNYQRLVSDASLSVDSGCVAFTGPVKEIARGIPALDVYPNPSQGKVNISLSHESSDVKINRLEIINTTGIVVLRMQDTGSQIDLSHLPSGLYLLRAETSNGILSKRLILQN